MFASNQYEIIKPEGAYIWIDDINIYQEMVEWGIAIYKGWGNVVGKTFSVACKGMAVRWLRGINDDRVINAICSAIETGRGDLQRSFRREGHRYVLVEFFIAGPGRGTKDKTYFLSLVEGRRQHGCLMITMLEPGGFRTAREIIARDVKVQYAHNQYMLQVPPRRKHSNSYRGAHHRY